MGESLTGSRVLVSLAIACAAAATLGAQVFRVSTDAVRVDVLVTDGRGAAVSGLSLGDFELRDNGVPQTVIALDREDVPIHAVLALDVSDSVDGERVVMLRQAADAFLGRLAPDDRATVLTFNQRIEIRSEVGAVPAAARAALGDVQAFGQTSVFDAAWTALTLSTLPPSRSLVVVLSDGFDNASWLTDDTVLGTARRSDAVAYGVMVRPALRFWRPDLPRRPFDGTRDFLRRLTEESGGRLVDAGSYDRVQATFLDVLGEMRDRYVLSYIPERVAAGGWHAITVTTKRSGTKVTARRGYQRELPGR